MQSTVMSARTLDSDTTDNLTTHTYTDDPADYRSSQHWHITASKEAVSYRLIPADMQCSVAQYTLTISY